MTIQRQYNLPNCTLVLEGLGDTFANPADVRPLMSILINAECYLVGEEKPLSGGREFFEGLVKEVGQYAQELMSGVRAVRPEDASRWVHLRSIGSQHRLSMRPPDAIPGSGIAAHLTREIDLTTVQLFDLVEAVDQFFADTQTLPDMLPTLQPLPKRFARSGEPLAKQAVPAAVGVSSLALAAIALMLAPVPKVSQPTCLKASEPGCTSTPTAGQPGSPSASAPAGSSPSPTASAATASPSPVAAIAASPSPSSTTVAPPDLTNLESTLNTAPEITDPAQLTTLGKQLQSQLDQAWKTRTSLTEDLVYRLGVAKDGSIIGYKPVNPAALTNARQTPLLDLLYRPATGSAPSSEPIAQFKAVFTPSGLVEVAPWREVMTTAQQGTEITDNSNLEELLPKLRQQILKDGNEITGKFDRDLVFRVRVKADGAIVDYKPDNQSAIDHVEATPLPKLSKVADDSAAPLQEPHALFKVVFRSPDGRLEISPWRGWQ